MSLRLNRRALLRSTALAGVGTWVSGGIAGAAPTSPNEKLNLAFVGCGGRGAANIDGLRGQNIVALCDADQARAAGVFERFPKARQFQDFRKMLDEMAREIDAVVVSAPNHIHAPASVMAMRMGKHVYCEKPLRAFGLRGPRGRPGGCGREGGHADGHADPRQRQLPPGDRTAARRGHRHGARGGRVDHGGRRGRRPAQGNPACAAHSELGHLVGARSLPPLSLVLSAASMALLVGLRRRRAG